MIMIRRRPRSFGRVVALGALAAVTLGAGALLSGEARADKLIFFKNGKALRVKSVKEDGVWLRCVLEDKNVLSVPNSGVQSIAEASTPAREGPTNQVAVGTGTPYTGRGGGGGGGGEQPDYAAAAEAAAAAAEAQEQATHAANQEQTGVTAAGAPRAGFGRNAVGGRRGGVGAQPNASNNPMLPGFQPMNQAVSPFPNRNRALNQQPQRNNPGRFRAQVPQQLQPNNGAEEPEN